MTATILFGGIPIYLITNEHHVNYKKYKFDSKFATADRNKSANRKRQQHCSKNAQVYLQRGLCSHHISSTQPARLATSPLSPETPYSHPARLAAHQASRGDQASRERPYEAHPIRPKAPAYPLTACCFGCFYVPVTMHCFLCFPSPGSYRSSRPGQ